MGHHLLTSLSKDASWCIYYKPKWLELLAPTWPTMRHHLGILTRIALECWDIMGYITKNVIFHENGWTWDTELASSSHFFWEILGDFRKFHWDDLFLLLRWCSMGFKVYITNWTITMLLMGESTISMSIFSSYVSLPEASYNGMWFEYYGDMMLIVHGIHGI